MMIMRLVILRRKQEAFDLVGAARRGLEQLPRHLRCTKHLRFR